MNKMKFNDLKAFLEKHKGANVYLKIVDNDGAELVVTDIIETEGGSIGFVTQEEFPDAWFDENGNEIDWELDWTKEIKRSTFAEESEIYVQKPGLIESEMCINFRCYDGFAVSDAGIIMSYPKTSELTAEQIAEINEYCGGAVYDSKTVVPHDVALKYGQLLPFKAIMDTSNSHDKGLVDAINVKWNLQKDRFRTILIALYDRDLYEIMYSDAFKWPEAAGSDYVFSDLQTQWDTYAENYLMHIADDQDLKTILQFVK